jgi:hypothetical protein
MSTPEKGHDLPALEDGTVVVRFTWRALRVVDLDAVGKLRFPEPGASGCTPSSSPPPGGR